MECGAKLSKLPSPKARSSGWVGASCSFIRGEGVQPMPKIVKETLMVPWSAVWHLGRWRLTRD